MKDLTLKQIFFIHNGIFLTRETDVHLNITYITGVRHIKYGKWEEEGCSKTTVAKTHNLYNVCDNYDHSCICYHDLGRATTISYNYLHSYFSYKKKSI